jgi:hypothetical protein
MLCGAYRGARFYGQRGFVGHSHMIRSDVHARFRAVVARAIERANWSEPS